MHSISEFENRSAAEHSDSNGVSSLHDDIGQSGSDVATPSCEMTKSELISALVRKMDKSSNETLCQQQCGENQFVVPLPDGSVVRLPRMPFVRFEDEYHVYVN